MEPEIDIVKKLNPNLEHYEFIGKVEFLSPEEGKLRLDKWEEETSRAIEIEAKVNPKFGEDDESKHDEDEDRGILVYADGRVFKEKSRKNRRTNPSSSNTSISKIDRSKDKKKIRAQKMFHLMLM